MSRLAPIAILLLLGALGCAKPTVYDIAGTWVMTNNRKFLPPEVQKAAGTIMLNADGTFSASELPVLFWDGTHGPPQSTSGTGVWKLDDSLGLGLQVMLTFQAITAGKALRVWPGMPTREAPLPYGTNIGIRRAWFVGPGFILNYMMPDESVIEFEKKPS